MGKRKVEYPSQMPVHLGGGQHRYSGNGAGKRRRTGERLDPGSAPVVVGGRRTAGSTVFPGSGSLWSRTPAADPVDSAAGCLQPVELSCLGSFAGIVAAVIPKGTKGRKERS